MKSTFQQFQSHKDPLLKEIANVGERLTTDILGELTRKRQNNLLIWSFVTVLISLSMIQPTEGAVTIFKFPITNVSSLQKPTQPQSPGRKQERKLKNSVAKPPFCSKAKCDTVEYNPGRYLFLPDLCVLLISSV